MDFNFPLIKNRIESFVSFYLDEFKKSMDLDPNRGYSELVKLCNCLVTEEKLFFTFLSTHFDDNQTALNFYNKLTWGEFLNCTDSNIKDICECFFQKKCTIGDHRKYFRCLPYLKNGRKTKARYTEELLISYRNAIKGFGTQANFFSIGKKIEFPVLFERLAQIEHIHRRLPRWDHLESLTCTNQLFIYPDRLYLEVPTYSGPMAGFFYILSGRRNKADVEGRNYIIQILPRHWNSVNDSNYQIQSGASFENSIAKLEIWLINMLQKNIPIKYQRPTFIYDVESCLCNWQKGKAV